MAGTGVVTRRPHRRWARWVRRICAAATALTCSVPFLAEASELLLDAPEGCANADELGFELRRGLGAPLEHVGRMRFQVRVDTSDAGASARLSVSSIDEDGGPPKQRRLVAPDCAKLVETLALAISLALAAAEPETAAPPSPTSPKPHEERAPPRPREVQKPGDASPSEVRGSLRRTGAGLHTSVIAAFLGDTGSLPAPAFGASLGVELGDGKLALRVLGALLFEQRVPVTRSAGADVGLAFGTALGCANVLGTGGPLTLPLCIGVDVGQLSGTGFGVATVREGTALWLSPRVEGGLYWAVPATELRLGAQLSAAAPLNRDEFVLDRIGAVHRPAPVVGRAGLGLHLTL